MKVDTQIIAAVETAFKVDHADPVETLAKVQVLAAYHGSENVLAALAQLHLVSVARLRLAIHDGGEGQ